ncbi:MAG TPA: SDR family NAD(P)-dependent oxidoreductase [Caulobacterales bacterium]|nr:SDR family NAD(P)-dependent oxidoreductase [Caulobacterales bacterium]
MTDARIALVTGASRGIGRAAARLLARQGWRVVCVARSQKALESLDDEIKADGKGEATLAPLDLRDYESIDKLGAALYERFGKLDGLAACAGALGQLTPAHQASPALMEETTAVNYLANQRLIRSMHPLLRASDAGRAVFVTSGVAKNPRAYWAPYAASKAALDALVICYAQEIAITPIKANLYNPGPTATGMRAKAFPGEDPATLAQPDDVAPQLVALLSPACDLNGARVQYEPAREKH